MLIDLRKRSRGRARCVLQLSFRPVECFTTHARLWFTTGSVKGVPLSVCIRVYDARRSYAGNCALQIRTRDGSKRCDCIACNLYDPLGSDAASPKNVAILVKLNRCGAITRSAALDPNVLRCRLCVVGTNPPASQPL